MSSEGSQDETVNWNTVMNIWETVQLALTHHSTKAARSGVHPQQSLTPASMLPSPKLCSLTQPSSLPSCHSPLSLPTFLESLTQNLTAPGEVTIWQPCSTTCAPSHIHIGYQMSNLECAWQWAVECYNLLVCVNSFAGRREDIIRCRPSSSTLDLRGHWTSLQNPASIWLVSIFLIPRASFIATLKSGCCSGAIQVLCWVHSRLKKYPKLSTATSAALSSMGSWLTILGKLLYTLIGVKQRYSLTQ